VRGYFSPDRRGRAIASIGAASSYKSSQLGAAATSAAFKIHYLADSSAALH